MDKIDIDKKKEKILDRIRNLNNRRFWQRNFSVSYETKFVPERFRKGLYYFADEKDGAKMRREEKYL